MAARKAAIAAKSKARRGLFEAPGGTGKGSWLQRVFKTTPKSHSLAWVRKPDGTLADTPEELAEVVTAKYTAWFSSVTTVEERWGSWDNMMNGNVERMDELHQTKHPIAPGIDMSFADLVGEAYPTLQNPPLKCFDGFLDPIINAEVVTSIKAAKAHTAPGESMVHIDALKALTESNCKALTAMFNEFLANRRISWRQKE